VWVFQWLIIWFFGALQLALPEIIKRIALYLGFSLATITGLNYIETQLIQKFQDQLVGVPLLALQFVGMMNVDKALTLMLSAFAFRKLMDGWSATGTRSTWTSKDPWNGPGGPGGGV